MTIDPKTLYDTLISMVIPVFAGFLAAKFGVLSDDFSKKLSSLILYVCQPFMLATAVMGAEYSKENLNAGLTVLACGFIAHAFAAAIAFGGTFFLKDKTKARMIEHCMQFGNCGFFGFPMAKVAFGSKGLFYGGFFIIAFNVVMWSYGVLVIGRANKDLKIKLTKIFLNAGTVPCTIGLLLYILRIPIYSPVFNSMNMIGDTCTPLSMILVGMMLARIPIKKYVTEYHCYYATAVKIFVVPIGSALVLNLLGFSELYCLFGAMMMALPCASSCAMFARNYDTCPEFAAQTVGVSTLISVLTIPPVMQLIQYLI